MAFFWKCQHWKNIQWSYDTRRTHMSEHNTGTTQQPVSNYFTMKRESCKSKALDFEVEVKHPPGGFIVSLQFRTVCAPDQETLW